MNKKIAIIGAGGHGKVIGEIALLNQYNVIHFFDNRDKEIKEFPFTIVGNLDYLKDHLNEYDSFFIAIGENQKRYEIMQWLKKLNVKNIVNLIHPNSTVSKFSFLSSGTCIMANAVINPGTFIKEGVIINTSTSVDHDCIIDDFVHISPNSTLSGGIKVGKFTHLGSGTSVHPNIIIGNNVKIGIGSRVFKNILDNTIFKN